jgi:hypothetical protein
VATIFEQSELHEIPYQSLIPLLRATQLAPLSMDLYIYPPFTVATIVQKSADTAIPVHFRMVELYVIFSEGYDPADITEQVALEA